MKNPTKYHVLQSQKRQVREFLLDDSISDRGGTTAIVKKPHFLCPPKTAFMPRSAPETSTASGIIHKLRHILRRILINPSIQIEAWVYCDLAPARSDFQPRYQSTRDVNSFTQIESFGP